MDEFFATAMSHYERGSVELEVTAMIAEDDQVVLQWTSRARTRDGQPYENGCIGVFTIRDGAITAVREYMDTLYVSDTFAGEARSTETIATEFAARNDRMVREGTRNLLAATRAAGAHRIIAQSIAWELPGERGLTYRDHEQAVLDAGGVVIRYGRLYGPGTYYPTERPAAPRIEVDEAARRTVALLGAAPGIVELVEAPVDTGRISAVPETREVAHAD
jgi:SnoaL-like domain